MILTRENRGARGRVGLQWPFVHKKNSKRAGLGLNTSFRSKKSVANLHNLHSMSRSLWLYIYFGPSVHLPTYLYIYLSFYPHIYPVCLSFPVLHFLLFLSHFSPCLYVYCPLQLLVSSASSPFPLLFPLHLGASYSFSSFRRPSQHLPRPSAIFHA
jgi:hypothetical protein